jgi:hypothetical protein
MVPTVKTAKPLPMWSIYIARSKLHWLGDVEAASEAEAIKIGAEKFAQHANRLVAVKRG